MNCQLYYFLLLFFSTVLNMAAIKSVIKSGHKCAADDNPDDMMMGMFSKRLNIPVLHSPLFHQVSDGYEYLL